MRMREGHMIEDLACMRVRFSPEIRQWLAAEARRNASSMNSEIVRAVVERVERVATERKQRDAAAPIIGESAPAPAS